MKHQVSATGGQAHEFLLDAVHIASVDKVRATRKDIVGRPRGRGPPCPPPLRRAPRPLAPRLSQAVLATPARARNVWLPGAAPSGLEGLGTFFLNMFGVLPHHSCVDGLPHGCVRG